MFKIKSLRKVLVIMVALAVFAFNSAVFATSVSIPTSSGSSGSSSSTPVISPLTGSSSGTSTSVISGIATPTPTTAAIPTPTPTSSVVSSSTYGSSKNSNLPKTGVDYSVVFILLASVVITLFAYKKIKEYNSIKY